MTQKQELKLTPQMLQSMELLQMSAQELEAYLQELVQENPAAELSEPEERQDEGEELWRRMQSLADQDNQNRQYVAAEREELDPLARIGTDGGLEDTLLLHLSRQLERSQAPTLVLRGAQFLAACLDESGYLREEVENLAQAAGLPAAVLEEGLSLLQTLDPAGVGARDLSQCLELQLRQGRIPGQQGGAAGGCDGAAESGAGGDHQQGGPLTGRAGLQPAAQNSEPAEQVRLNSLMVLKHLKTTHFLPSFVVQFWMES